MELLPKGAAQRSRPVHGASILQEATTAGTEAAQAYSVVHFPAQQNMSGLLLPLCISRFSSF